MPSVKTWNTFSEWSEWVNEINPTGDQGDLRRIVGTYMKLPFNPINPSGINAIARWRFGQNQDLSDDTGNGHTATLQSTAEVSELGLNLPNRNAHVTVAELGSFSPTKPYWLACWFKSNDDDYSDRFGIIAGHTKGVGDGEIEYALAINDTNKIVGFVYDGSTTRTAPVSEDAVDNEIDTSWHVAFLLVGSTLNTVLLDNNYTVDQSVVVASTTISGSPQFAIGSGQFNTSYGFTGIVDEVTLFQGNTTLPLETFYRFSTNIFLSPVIDTSRSLSIVSSVLAEYDSPNGSAVSFAFRASDTEFDIDDTTVPWTGFTAPNQTVDAIEANLVDLGLFVQGRYVQVKVKMSPSNANSPIEDNLQLDTPVLKSLTLNTSPPDLIIHPTAPAYQPGTILGQVVEFSGSKRIDKVSLNLSVTSTDPKDFVVGSSGRLSWNVMNFSSARNEWVLQPIPHWSDDYNWKSSGLSVKNTLQSESYTDVADVAANAPYLTYSLFFPTGGVWKMWGYGWSQDSIWWSVDSDTTHLRQASLGRNISGFYEVPYWTNFGSLFFEEGGLHTFTVYLGNSPVILDQWLFTSDLNLTTTLDESVDSAYTKPLPLSEGPFTSVCRLRSLENGIPVPISDPPTGSKIVTSYQSSTNIRASGKFNFEIKESNSSGVSFANGVFIEYMQIGGNSKNFASWDYNFV